MLRTRVWGTSTGQVSERVLWEWRYPEHRLAPTSSGPVSGGHSACVTVVRRSTATPPQDVESMRIAFARVRSLRHLDDHHGRESRRFPHDPALAASLVTGRQVRLDL
jgi:hypothetical protein